MGTIIGAGIFQTAPIIARHAGNFTALISLWLLGGLVTVIGALCFAELTTRFRDLPGGDYGFLKLAFGRPLAFMFAWATFWIIRPGNIGAMAFTFAIYFDQLLGFATTGDGKPAQLRHALFAIAAVLLLSLASLIGLKQAKWIQNLLTAAKVIGILAICGLAFLAPASQGMSTQLVGDSGSEGIESMWLLAMVFIMFSFGGWNDLSFVATEIRNPEKNLFRALILGSLAVTAIYALINIAFVFSLGYDSVVGSSAVATDVVKNSLGPDNWIGNRCTQLIAGLICISCLGAINGIVITSPRIYYAAGRDFEAIRVLGKWDGQRNQPWIATALQAIVTIGLFSLCFRYDEPFKVIVTASAPFFWTFLGLAGLSLIVLRYRAPKQPNNQADGNFRVPMYPLEPLILATVCFLMTYSSIQYLISEKLWSAGGVVGGLMVAGILLGVTLKANSETNDSG